MSQVATPPSGASGSSASAAGAAAADAKFDYDLIVVGGGSGGMAAAKEAARANPTLRVALFDYVTPTPHGTRWKLGGTCVNVGCIPKKLFHYTGNMRTAFEDAQALGWQLDAHAVTHRWDKMVRGVTDYIKSLNHAYKKSLKAANVNFIEAYASFVDAHTVRYEKDGKEATATAKHFIVAVGGRPHYPDIPGAQLAITSDDIFWRSQAPGKTLVVGGGYIALECASFLHELGYDATVMVRSILLRGFDQQCANQIGELLERSGVRFIRPAVPVALAANDNKSIKVTFESLTTHEKFSEDYDTVIFAIGRDPQVKMLSLDKAGIATDAATGKIKVDLEEKTSVANIYAIGDVTIGPAGSAARPELTPVAIQTGIRLARRLFAKQTLRMDWRYIPTTVFTTPEYGTVGYSQEAAEAELGADGVSVYVSRFDVLEHGIAEHPYEKPRSTSFIDENLWVRQQALARGLPWEDPVESFDQESMAMVYKHHPSLAKLVCDKKNDERVIGFHYIGPNAGEVTQGFSLAIRFGCTKRHFDEMVGIHPTSAEEFAVLATTLQSGADFMKKEGCGGGGSC